MKRGEGLLEKPPLPLHTCHRLWPPKPALLPSGEGGGQGSQAPSCQSSQPQPSWNRESTGRAAGHSSVGRGLGYRSRLTRMPPGGTYSLINATHYNTITPVPGPWGFRARHCRHALQHSPTVGHAPTTSAMSLCSYQVFPIIRGAPELIIECLFPANTIKKDCAL